MILSIMDHLQRGTTSINYVYSMNQDKFNLTIYDVSWFFLLHSRNENVKNNPYEVEQTYSSMEI